MPRAFVMVDLPPIPRDIFVFERGVDDAIGIFFTPGTIQLRRASWLARRARCRGLRLRADGLKNDAGGKENNEIEQVRGDNIENSRHKERKVC